MSASKLKQVTSTDLTSKESSSSSSAYTAYNAVDELVAKPVFGSDGAKKWQTFSQQSTTQKQQHIRVAPTAPLKAIDRATGFTSWKEEREYSNQIRQNDDHTNKNTAASSVYTNFTQKANHQNEMSSKERKRIERRIIGDHQEYFIPSSTFVGWKFDYIFTTRMESHGTGYYFDGMDSLKLLKGQISNNDIPASAKDLSIISPSETTSAIKHKRSHPAANGNIDTETTTTTSATTTNEEPTKKKKKKAKNIAPIIVNNPNHPLEQIAAILAQRQTTSQSSSELPMGWEFAKDSISGKNYYFNRTTGELTWEVPPSSSTRSNNVNNCIGTTAMSCNNNDTTMGRQCCWNVTKDPSTGKEYYYNIETGETSWEKPTTSI